MIRLLSVRAVLLMSAGVVLAACSQSPIRLYDGPRQAPAKVSTISMPEQIEVARVNGQVVEGAKGMAVKGDKVLEILPGRYEVLAYYRELWVHGDDSDILRSDPALFVIDAAPGHSYRIDYQRPHDLDEAQALAAKFTGWSMDLADGQKSTSLDSGLEFPRGPLAQLQGADTLIPAADRSTGGVQVVAPLPAEPPAVAVVPIVDPDEAAAKAALSQMQAWWMQADEVQRRAFLKWVGERQ
jgi:uncharacterized protein YccT (UPF0319 family)